MDHQVELVDGYEVHERCGGWGCTGPGGCGGEGAVATTKEPE